MRGLFIYNKPLYFFLGKLLDVIVSCTKAHILSAIIPGILEGFAKGGKGMKRIIKTIIAVSIMTVLVLPLPSSAATEGCKNAGFFKEGTYKVHEVRCKDGKAFIDKTEAISKSRIKTAPKIEKKVQKPVKVSEGDKKAEGALKVRQEYRREKKSEESVAAENPTPIKPEKDRGENGNLTAVSGSQEEQVLALVNKERAAVGLSPLAINRELSKVANVKAADMRDRGYFSHNSPTYGSPFDMMGQFGIKYTAAGENIAKGYPNAVAVMEGWMNSPGHRANILNSNYTQLGVGYVTDAKGTGYWVQMFIGI